MQTYQKFDIYLLHYIYFGVEFLGKLFCFSFNCKYSTSKVMYNRLVIK